MKRFLFVIILLASFSTVSHALPTYEEVRQSYVKSDSLLLDRNGEVLYELRTDKSRRRLDWVDLKNISPVLRKAVICAEDRRFFEHWGVDLQSVGAAVIQGLTTESLRGASTITMQVAALLDKELQPKKDRKSLWQKARQALGAREIEQGWSKDEILEAYLNIVTFRGELQGIAAASRGLFGKHPHGLDQSESLILASLIRSPNASSPELTKRVSRLSEILGWQVKEDEIRSKTRLIFLGHHPLLPRADLAPHAARRLLKGRPHGTSVLSTLDRRLQRFALDRMIHHLHPLRSQNVRDGAILIAENRTGNVLCYVSYSGDPLTGRFVDGVQAKRQTGSALKPFLYGLAFDQRILTPASLLDDSPLDLSVSKGIYQPRNYDSQFQGAVSARVALASSLNIPAVKTLSLVGMESFLKLLRQLGVQGLNESGDYYGPSLALGSADLTLWELVNAYRTLASEGEWSELRLTQEEKPSSQKRKVLSKESAFLISDILSDRDARSMTFGLENPLATRFWTAVKTGTSKDMRDNWCIGYSGSYTIGIWVGNFSGEPMWNVSGVTGAAPIWGELMNFLHRETSGPVRAPTAHVIKRKVEFPQGREPAREEWFIRGTEPNSISRAPGFPSPKILYPPSGTVVALDPDIPTDAQKIFFIAQTEDGDLRWMLNGVVMDRVGKTASWSPRAGKYTLAISDGKGNTLDSSYFEVRGPIED